MKLHDVLRAGIVNRWNIVATTREQSIAEHMWNTTMIAGRICDAIGMPPESKMTIQEYCMIHDRHEVITGDVPTPTKEKLSNWYEFVEKGIDSEADHYKLIYGDPEFITPKGAVVKLADIMDGEWFLYIYGIKTPHTGNIQKELKGKREKLLNYCMDNHPGYMWSRVSEVQEEIYDVRKLLTEGNS